MNVLASILVYLILCGAFVGAMMNSHYEKCGNLDRFGDKLFLSAPIIIPVAYGSYLFADDNTIAVITSKSSCDIEEKK